MQYALAAINLLVRQLPQALGADHARVHAHPTQATKQPGMFDLHAAVLDHLQPGGLGAQACGLVENAQLQPQALCADGDGLVGQRRDVLTLAKAVHHVDLLALRCQRGSRLGHAGVGRLAQDLPALTRHQRVDRHDAVAMRLHVLGRKVAGAVPLRREAHHRDGAAGGEQVAQGADGVGGAEHADQCTHGPE